MMNKKLKEKLVDYNKKNEYGISDNELAETLLECGETKKEDNHSKHRWYTTYRRVVKLDNFFVEFTTYTNSGDEPAFDTKDWHEMVLESAIEVIPKEVRTIDYFPIKEK